MIIKFILFLLFYFFIGTSNVYANQNIATLNLETIFKNSIAYSEFIVELNIIRKNYNHTFKKNELSLLDQKKKIDDSRLIFNESEINKIVELYKNEFNTFNKNVEKFNKKVSNLLEYNQQILMNQIIEISKVISTNNNFHIVLTEDNYFIASDNYDITNLIIEKLNLINIKLKIILD